MTSNNKSMKNLFKIIILFHLLSFSFSNNLEIGLGVTTVPRPNRDGILVQSPNFIFLSGQLNKYKINNFYQSYRVDSFLEFNPFCFSPCSRDNGIGFSYFYGKYYKLGGYDPGSTGIGGNFILISGTLGSGVNNIGNKWNFTFPINIEGSLIFGEKIGLSFRWIIYPFSKELDYGLSLNLKIENIF